MIKSTQFKAVVFFITTQMVICEAKAQAYDGILAEDVYINLDYAACYRGEQCARFEITLLGDGTAVFEGLSGVSEIGVFQKTINQQNIADLLTDLLLIRFFDRTDESSNCSTKVEVLSGGDYDMANSVCYTSSHGPFTEIKVRFGSKMRQVDLDNFYSSDYEKIKEKIIQASGFENHIQIKHSKSDHTTKDRSQ